MNQNSVVCQINHAHSHSVDPIPQKAQLRGHSADQGMMCRTTTFQLDSTGARGKASKAARSRRNAHIAKLARQSGMREGIRAGGRPLIAPSPGRDYWHCSTRPKGSSGPRELRPDRDQLPTNERSLKGLSHFHGNEMRD